MTPGAAQFEEATFSEADLHGRDLRTDLVWRTTSVPGTSVRGDARSGPVKRVSGRWGEPGDRFGAPVPERDRRDAGERRGRNVLCVGAV